VLTASATEMSDYFNNPFIAFVAGFPKGPIPLWFVRRMLYPPVERNGEDGRARYAPYGLRKVEAILLENGFQDSDVAVVHPFDLDRFVGPETKVVGISTMDPAGMGYVSKTYTSIVGGRDPMSAIEFRELVKHPNIQKYKPKVIVGGFGSWQLERKKVMDDYGIDCVFIGEGESAIAELFRRAVNGESIPRTVRIKKGVESERVPTIKHAAIHGGIEISRGCGRNCQFCTPTMQMKRDISLEKIMAELEVTVREGCSRITLVTDDMFLYGSQGKSFIPNREAIVKMVKSVASHPGVKAVQPSHTSLAPVVCDPVMVQEVAEILIERYWYSHKKKPIVTSETGIETGSVRLMRKYMAGKMLPFKPEQWKEVISQSFGIMNDNDWYPLTTLIIGLPDEKEEDVIQTLELMDDLKGYNAFYVPLLFVPLENCLLMNKSGAELDGLTKVRWEFLTVCWEYNFRNWADTFIGNRVSNPFLFNFIRRGVMPVVGKMAGFYYGAKHGKQMKMAIEKWAHA